MAKKPTKPTKSEEVKATTRSVLGMSAKQARAFFLRPENYCNVDLPS